MRSLLLSLVLLAGCPGPGPVEPDPLPTPTGETPCARACDRMADLVRADGGIGCAGAGPNCEPACEAYEREAELAPALSWSPDCIAGALSCDGVERCRGGAP